MINTLLAILFSLAMGSSTVDETATANGGNTGLIIYPQEQTEATDGGNTGLVIYP